MQKNLDKFLWVLLGGAIGDALWAPVEFLSRGEFPWVDEYLSNPEHDHYEWERTDDTAMTLLLAESLIRKKRFDIEDQLTNYLKRWLSGYMGLRDYPQGMGSQTLKMLQAYLKYRQAKAKGEKHHKPWEVDLSGCDLDGNGSLMRIGAMMQRKLFSMQENQVKLRTILISVLSLVSIILDLFGRFCTERIKKKS